MGKNSTTAEKGCDVVDNERLNRQRWAYSSEKNGRVLIKGLVEGLTVILRPLRRRSSLMCLCAARRASRRPSKSNHVVSLMMTTRSINKTEAALILF